MYIYICIYISADNALFRPLRSLQFSWLNEAPRQSSLIGKDPKRMQCPANAPCHSAQTTM